MALKDVVVPVPDEFVDQEGGLQGARDALTRAAVLEMVRKGSISAGRGAELLDLPTRAFLRLMGAHGISLFDYGTEELAYELKPLSEH